MLPFASIEHAYELDYAPSGAGNNECKSNIESAAPDQSKECVNSPVRWPHPTCFSSARFAPRKGFNWEGN
jgi:hypothetical protein